MTDLMAEVDAAMRQERIEKFWQENGKFILTCVILTIIATGAISAYRSWDRSVKMAHTEKLLQITEAENFPDNLKDAKLDIRPGLRGIALINGAQAFLQDKKTDEALALYTRAADDGSIPEELRGLAVLQLARLSPDAASNDKLMGELQDVAKDGGSPWQYHARIEAAAFAAAKEDYKQARNYLAGVMDQSKVADTLYKKAQALDHVYALKEQEKSAASKEEAREKKEGS